MLDKMKELFEMQKKMQEMKRQLDAATFEVESPDGTLLITMTGSQEVKEVVIKSGIQEPEKSKLEKSIKDVYNKAVKRSHDIAAQKMKQISGLNLPGMV